MDHCKDLMNDCNKGGIESYVGHCTDCIKSLADRGRFCNVAVAQKNQAVY